MNIGQKPAFSLPFWVRWSPVGAVLLLWELAPRLGLVSSDFVPPFSEVCHTIGILISNGSLLSNLLATMLRVLAGFTLAFVIAIPGGAYLAQSPSVRYVLNPFLRALSQVNPFSLLPVFLLFFGSGEAVKIAALTWVALWPILFFTTAALLGIEPSLRKAAESFGATHWEVFCKVEFPAAIPTLCAGARIAGTLAFFVIIGAEMLGTNSGLGWLVHNSGMNYQIPGIYAGAFCIIVLGFFFSRTLTFLERRAQFFFTPKTESTNPESVYPSRGVSISSTAHSSFRARATT